MKPMEPAERIWRESHEPLRAFISRRLPNEADVDDAMQEVFIRLEAHLSTLRRADRLAAWLFQVTRNVIADHHRSPTQRREQTAGSVGEMEGDRLLGASEADLDGQSAELHLELAACLRPMLESLPPSYRDALVMVELDGLSQATAAERLGLSVSGVKSRVQRGRRKLEELMRECCDIELDARRRITSYARRDGSCESCIPRD
jgi:RNA polymerase sigma-70 factor (ECF subfamily)